jgi:hypothetical protein
MSTHAAQSGLGRVHHGRSEHRVNRRVSLVLFALVLVLVGAIAGKEIANNHTGNSPVTIESRSVNAGNASHVVARLMMQPGNLQIQGGVGHLLDARFVYQPAAWRPSVSYRVTGSRGELAVRQPHLQSVTSSQNTWNVGLSDRMPMNLEVTSGPGNATLSLRPLMLNMLTIVAGPGNVTIDAGSPSLRALKITAGPGNLTINLNAPWKHNVAATIDGGIGNTTLRLPTTIGAQVTVQGMGQVTAPDFARQGDSYVNAAFGNTKVAVHVSLTAGIGNVVLTTGA